MSFISVVLRPDYYHLHRGKTKAIHLFRHNVCANSRLKIKSVAV